MKPTRPPGRPKLDAADDSVPVHLTLTARDYNTTYERARLARVSVPEIIRRDVKAAQKKNSK
jgi:hypothetical protein